MVVGRSEGKGETAMVLGPWSELVAQEWWWRMGGSGRANGGVGRVWVGGRWWLWPKTIKKIE